MRWTVAILLTAAVAGLGIAVAAAQDSGEEQPLRREADAPKVVDEVRIRELVKDLGAEDYDRRDAAFRELLRLGDAAVPALEAARKSQDVQVRVSAERLLRRIRRAPEAEEPSRRLSPDRERERTVEDWLRELEERGFRGMDLEEWRRMMDLRLEEMRRQIRDLERDLERDIRDAPAPGITERHVVLRTDDESIECRVDAGGKVTVTVETREDGAAKSTTYEAPSVEEFRTRHPDVWEKVKGVLGDGGGFRIRIGPGPREWPFRTPRWPVAPTPEPAPDAPRLGFYVGDITPALRSHLGLVPEEGLLVEEVVPGTLAERLGLRRYDVLLRVLDRSVGSPEDVADALAVRDEGSPVKVLVVRQGRRIELVETE